jgi:hypothetical protein
MYTIPPRASALTTPALEIDADAGSDEFHVTGLARSRFSPSSVLALACAVLPIAIVATEIVTTTRFTAAGSTVIAELALLDGFSVDEAEIVAGPSATPMTSPELVTEATPGAFERHVTACDTPAVPCTVAVSAAVSST